MLATPNPTTPRLKVWMVFRYVNGVQTFLGNVQAENHVLADRKAAIMFGSNVWCKEK